MMAKGYGFDYGSSFASPLIAASFWLKKLIYNDHRLDAKSMVNATIPPMNSEISKKVKYDGVFEPFVALASDESFVVSQNNLYSVEGCSGNINFKDKEWISYSTASQSNKSSYD